MGLDSIEVTCGAADRLITVTSDDGVHVVITLLTRSEVAELIGHLASALADTEREFGE